MASRHLSIARHRRCSESRPAWGRLPSACAAAAAAIVLAGCGGGGDPGTDVPVAAGTPVLLSEAQAVPVSKPVLGADAVAAPATGATPATSKPPVASKPLVVPVVAGKVRYGIPSAAMLGVGGSLEGTVPFAPDDAWNRDVSKLPADPASDALIARIGSSLPLQLGFGRTEGIPYVVVAGTQPTVAVRHADGIARDWPIPADAVPSADAARRLVVLERDAGRLFELHGAAPAADGAWTVEAATAWALDATATTPLDATASPAPGAGMPLFAGLLRADEASAGVIRHALRVTVPWLRDAWLPPARRADAGIDDAALPPFGLRLRLKAGFEIPQTLSTHARTILQALKTYGMIVVGTGPAWTIQGAPDAGWDTVRLTGELALVRGEDFEVLPMDGLTVVR